MNEKERKRGLDWANLRQHIKVLKQTNLSSCDGSMGGKVWGVVSCTDDLSWCTAVF